MGKNIQDSRVKEELVAKLNAIREAPIPDSVAGKSTEKVRSSIEAFCAAMQAYIDSLDDDQRQTGDELCSGFDNPEDERQCLLEEIAQYGVAIAGIEYFENEQLRIVLNVLQTMGLQISECLSQLPSHTEEKAQDAFQKIFVPNPGNIQAILDFYKVDLANYVWDGKPYVTFAFSSATTGEAQPFYLKDRVPDLPDDAPNPMVGFQIVVPLGEDTTEIIERILRHEFGHAFLDLLLETSRGKSVEYVNESTGETYRIPAVLAEYLMQIKDENWQILGEPWQTGTLSYYPGPFTTFVQVGNELTEVTGDIEDNLLLERNSPE